MEVAFSALQDAIVWTNQDGEIQWCNQAFLSYVSVNRIMLIGKKLAEVLPLKKRGQPVPTDKHPASLYNTKGEEFTASYEFDKDDKTYLLEISGTGLKVEGAARHNVVMIIRDITDMRVADEIRTQGLALSAAANAIVITDQEGLIEWVNPAFVNMTGYPETDCLGQPFRLLKSGCQNEEFYRELWDTITSGKIWKGELVNRRKDGSLYHEEETITPVLDNQGAITHFIAIKQDISERKEYEANLKEARQQLQEANDNLFAVLDESKFGVLMIDAKGTIKFVNHTVQMFLKKGKVDLLGKHWKDALPLTKENVQSLSDQFYLSAEERPRVKFKFSPDGSEIFWGKIEMRDDPRDSDKKILFVYDATEVNRLRSQLSASISRQIIGSSKAMKEMFANLNNVATGDWTVLIEGETGVGKELVAKAIHGMSTRKDGPFVAVNCGGLTSSLLTSQLFGYRRGSFTGASADQVGLFEAAHGGTLFLDEIGDVPLDVQVAMLRVLEEREVTRVGDTKPRKIDVRVLAATHRNLVQEVSAGRFRNDLLYRIRVARISVPSLRERLEDIPLLANSFLLNAQVRANKRIEGVDPFAMQALLHYHWPGNVRELKNAIDISAINCETQMIRVEDLPQELVSSPIVQPTIEPLSSDLKMQLEVALKKTGGNRSKAAKLVGVSRATFYRRLIDAGIDTRKK
jgi:PAS domain S-box-containing protein